MSLGVVSCVMLGVETFWCVEVVLLVVRHACKSGDFGGEGVRFLCAERVRMLLGVIVVVRIGCQAYRGTGTMSDWSVGREAI